MATTSGTKTFLQYVSTWVRDCSDLEGCKLTVNSATTYDISYCGDMALYYLNKYGGWDSFLIEGVCKRIDTLTPYTTTHNVTNTSLNFEDNRYMVEIKPNWELHTGWLTDEQAEILADNLIPSTQVYLHNLKTDEIMPAYITDTTSEFKTFKNNSKKLINYTLTVAESHTKVRR